MGLRRRPLRHRRCLRRSSGVRDGDLEPGAGSGRVPRRDLEPARLAECRPLAAVRAAPAVCRHQCRQHGQHDQPLHGQQEGPQRRRLFARRPDRPAARSRHDSLLPAGARGVSRRADHRRRRRGLAPPPGPLRLLERHRPPGHHARRQGRPRRLRHGRAPDRHDRQPAGRRRNRQGPERHARRGLCARGQRVAVASRRRDRAAVVRRGQDRQAQVRPGDQDHPSGDKPLERQAARAISRPPGDRLQPAPVADQPGRHGPDLRPALHAQAAPDVQGAEDPGLRGRQGLGDHHARLLRRLHVLLDHRPPGADHPVAVAGIGPGRAAADGPGPELFGRRLRHRRARRPTCTR